MSYTRPDHDAADASWLGASAYTRPDFDAADASFEPTITDVEIEGAAALGAVTASGVVSHGVSIVGAATLGPVTADGEIEATDPAVEIDGAATLGAVTADGSVGHGVAMAGAAVLGPVVADGQVAHGIAMSGEASLGQITGLGLVAHGIAISGAATLGPIVALGEVLHPRYTLQGEVRDAGVLVNRMVYAYRTDNGDKVGEQETLAGRFDIHAGWEERMHFVVPIDTAEDASDWMPPTANRVLSVLAMDA